ncbi:tRNA nucleotidyltransferase/CCA-adding enzyme [Nitzschia inconspicua]|uniref:tRNA nucleotidyltransferase/CCA-adding enzyme n=1 Tax=Nitzschia inconspicua TaxID=303405 RepID=A0A9K3M8M4_9STRA|nr:tRNA nucleotidyltransferase/CCA-adding enzyme [Nitzschia inconspicua]
MKRDNIITIVPLRSISQKRRLRDRTEPTRQESVCGFSSRRPIAKTNKRSSSSGITITAMFVLTSLLSQTSHVRALSLTTKPTVWRKNHPLLASSSVVLRHGRPSTTSLFAQDSRQLRFFGHLIEEERATSSSASANQWDGDSWIWTSTNDGQSRRIETAGVLVSTVGGGLVEATSGKAFFSTMATTAALEAKSRDAPNESGKSGKSTRSKPSDKCGGIQPSGKSDVNSHDDDSTGPHFSYPPSAEPKRGYGPYIMLSQEERELFHLLRQARSEMELSTTLRVAGGWVRDKLLATPEFARVVSSGGGRLTSKYKAPSGVGSAGRQGAKVIGQRKNNNKKNCRVKNGIAAATKNECQPPVDIDIALDDMLGREFAEHLNQYLGQRGEQTHSVGVVLKNPEKSKHLETATMKVGTFWIDFVNLRAEEYTQDSRIPDLMRIGSPAEDAFRRDLTINSLFYNVNNGQVEDWTGRGFDDLRRGVVSTPLAPLTTLLDDPLRTLRSIRFAARLRFTMDDALIEAAMDGRVRQALAEKVSRERIGCELDLMLRSPDPVGAMRLLINLNLARTVFPIETLCEGLDATKTMELFEKGLNLLNTNHEQLEECKLFPPVWCNKDKKDSYTSHGITELTLSEDDEARRFLWYASFLKPLYDFSNQIPEEEKSKRQGKKANRSVISKLLVDQLKRPTKEAEAVERIMKGAKDFKRLMDMGGDITAESILLSAIEVREDATCSSFKCTMNGEQVYTATENDPVWEHAMEFRLLCAKVMRKVGSLWRAALFLAMSEDIEETLKDDLPYVIEGDIMDETQEELREREIERYDAFATAMQRLGLVGIWGEKPLLDGGAIKSLLPQIPKGPSFREVMDEQEKWMTLHPCAGEHFLAKHLMDTFPDYVGRKGDM